MTSKPISRAWWYRLILGLLAAFSWCVAMAAFAGRLSALRVATTDVGVLTAAGWGLGLCAFVLIAELLGKPTSSRWHPR